MQVQLEARAGGPDQSYFSSREVVSCYFMTDAVPGAPRGVLEGLNQVQA